MTVFRLPPYLDSRGPVEKAFWLEACKRRLKILTDRRKAAKSGPVEGSEPTEIRQVNNDSR